MRKESKLLDGKEQAQYNPVKRAEEVARVVCRDDLKRYFRLRPAKFYGGIATAKENLSRANVYSRPAVMVSFSPLESIENLKRRIGRIDKGFEDIEIEELVLYGDIEKRLKRSKLSYVTAYEPEHIPTKKV